MTNANAYILREATGTTSLVETARRTVASILADHDIPHLFVGGLAVRRLKDKADVIELIKYRNLPRDLAVAPAVRHLYLETWDALAAEK